MSKNIATVLIKFDDDTILGQRDVSITGGETEDIDISDVHDFPDRVFMPGWNSPETIELPNMVLVSGEGGYASLCNKADVREIGEIVITMNDNGVDGDVGTGQAYLKKPTMTKPWDKEGTMSVKLQVVGKITWVQGA